MSLLNIFDLAGSGMSAQSLRLNVTASNMANADSVAGSPEQAYKSRHPVFAARLTDAENKIGGLPGVKVMAIVQSKAEHMQEYAPGHPLANSKGYIYHSNINVVEEMTNMIVASRNYQNNIEMMNTSKQLALRTLELGK